MKQIGNWVFGSFFRTIGRLLVFVVIGIILAHFINFGDILDNFQITDLLGIETIKADSSVATIYENYYLNSNKTTQTDYINNYATQTLSVNQNSVSRIYYYLGTTVQRTNNYDYFLLPYMILGQTYNNTTYNTVEYVCSWESYTDNTNTTHYYPVSCGYQVNGSQSIPVDINLHFNIRLVSDYSSTACYLQNNFVRCDLVPGQEYKYIMFEYNLPISNSGYDLKIGIQRTMTFFKDSSSTIINDIEQQTQQQQQQHNETIQTITDTNSTSDVVSSSDYILNQQDDTPSGLTAAVTAPLNILDQLVMGSSSPLCFTLNSKQTCIPDGSLIWGREYGEGRHWFDSGQFNPKNGFISLFNVIVGGYLCYKMLLSMLRVHNDVIDPTVSRIEVMKL